MRGMDNTLVLLSPRCQSFKREEIMRNGSLGLRKPIQPCQKCEVFCYAFRRELLNMEFEAALF